MPIICRFGSFLALLTLVGCDAVAPVDGVSTHDLPDQGSASVLPERSAAIPREIPKPKPGTNTFYVDQGVVALNGIPLDLPDTSIDLFKSTFGSDAVTHIEESFANFYVFHDDGMRLSFSRDGKLQFITIFIGPPAPSNAREPLENIPEKAFPGEVYLGDSLLTAEAKVESLLTASGFEFSEMGSRGRFKTRVDQAKLVDLEIDGRGEDGTLSRVVISHFPDPFEREQQKHRRVQESTPR